MEELVHESSKSRERTLVIDRWSNIHNERITASCVHINGKLHIIDIRNTGLTKKTREFLSKKKKAMIFRLLEKSGIAKIKNLVTDNAKNMERMKRELELKYGSVNL